jgi:hypothetical protein
VGAEVDCKCGHEIVGPALQRRICRGDRRVADSGKIIRIKIIWMGPRPYIGELNKVITGVENTEQRRLREKMKRISN